MLVAVALGGGETQQGRDTVAIRKILDDAFFQHRAELLPERARDRRCASIQLSGLGFLTTEIPLRAD